MKKTRTIKEYKNSIKIYLGLSLFVLVSTLVLFVYHWFTSDFSIADKMFLTGLTIFNTVFCITTFSYAQYVNAKYERNIKEEKQID